MLTYWRLFVDSWYLKAALLWVFHVPSGSAIKLRGFVRSQVTACDKIEASSHQAMYLGVSENMVNIWLMMVNIWLINMVNLGVSENVVYPIPNPMVLLIIIPMKNGYFIGNINPTFSDKPIWMDFSTETHPRYESYGCLWQIISLMKHLNFWHHIPMY